MENNHNIEELVAEKDFNNLSNAQKVMVIKELGTKEAYTEMRNFVLAFQNEDEEQAPAEMRQKIMDAYDKQHIKSAKKIIPFWKPGNNVIRQPLTYALIAASLLIAVFILLPYSSNNNNPQLAENKSKKEISKEESPQTEKKSNEQTEALQSIKEDTIDKNANNLGYTDASKTRVEPAILENVASEESEMVKDTESLTLADEPAETTRLDSEIQNLALGPAEIEKPQPYADNDITGQTIENDDESVMEVSRLSKKERIQSSSNQLSQESDLSDAKSGSGNTFSFRINTLEEDHYTGY